MLCGMVSTAVGMVGTVGTTVGMVGITVGTVGTVDTTVLGNHETIFDFGEEKRYMYCSS